MTWKKASRLYKAQLGVGCDGFHPEVALDLTKETRGEIVEFLEKWSRVASGRNKLVRRYFSGYRRTTSERPIAPMPRLIRWGSCESTISGNKSIELSDLDATDGRNGGGQRTVWGTLMEMERFNGRAKAEDQREVALILDLAKAFECVSLLRGLGLGDTLELPKEDLAGALRIFRAPVASAVWRMCGRAAPDHHGHSAGVQVELLVIDKCVAGCAE